MKRVAAIAISLFASAISLLAETHPNHERGFVPGKAYQVGEIDSIGLFNGNLNVTIPIGQSYPVGGTLSYGLSLSWSGNNWEIVGRRVDGGGCTPIECEELSHAQTVPDRDKFNAGMGWLVSFGALLNPTSEEGCHCIAYRSPDGAEHVFRNTLRDAGVMEPADPNVLYTQDGTYLRLRKTTVGGNQVREIDFPDGTVKRFGLDGRLMQIRDLHGNTVDFGYTADPATQAPIWIFSDSHGRTGTIVFKRISNDSVPSGSPDAASYDVVKTINLPAFNGTNATWTFHYGTNDNLTRISRQHVNNFDPALSPTVNVPLLTSVDLPDASKWRMARLNNGSGYDIGDGSTLSNPATGSFSGNLTGLILPTGGAIEWDYQMYRYPSESASIIQGVFGPKLYHAYVRSVGVKERRTRSVSNVDESKRTYETDLISLSEPGVYRAPRVLKNAVTDFLNPGDGQVATKTINYFSVVSNDSGNLDTEYGLPLTHEAAPDGNGTTLGLTNPDGDKGLSSITMDGAGNRLRATWLRYERDSSTSRTNARVAADKTLIWGTGGLTKYSTSERSDYDGYGHYRTTTFGGNFEGQNDRTSVVAYNRRDSAIDAETYDSGSYDWSHPGVGFTPRAPSQPWLLNLFSSQSSEEVLEGGNTSKAKTEYAYHDATGALHRVRTLRGTTRGANDLIVDYSHDAHGNITAEKYYGGVASVPTTGELDDVSLGTPTYWIGREWAYGTVSASRYHNSAGSALTFKTQDYTIDPSTGLASIARDSAEVPTTFQYDSMGRVTSMKSVSTNATTYAYSNAEREMSGALTPAKVTVHRDGTGMTDFLETDYTYDAFGRLYRERKRMADGTRSVQETERNAMGWTISQSEWFKEGQTKYSTEYSYDPLGRPTRIEAPDGSSVFLGYELPSVTTKTVEVHTSASSANPPDGNEITVTTETYDRFGRLQSITEPNATVTKYGYDVGDRLIKVCMNLVSGNCGQTRSFSYDNAGLLLAETHPEKGTAGNGTVTYSLHDARGHAKRRQDGPFQLDFVYDNAERLITVTDGTANRILKTFAYATTNDSTDRRLGRLISATRYNWIQGSGSLFNFQVVERYTYTGKDGRPNARVTEEYDCVVGGAETCTTVGSTPTRRFETGFAYDDHGAVSTIAYPDCTVGCGGIISGPTITNGRSNGFLTSVTFPDSRVNTITYSPNGMVGTVTHANGLTDTYTPDPTGMRRPMRISTSPANDPSTCVKPIITQQPLSATIQGSPITLSVTVSGDDVNQPTFQWYRGAVGATDQPLGQAASQVVSVAGTYWVRVQGCGATVDSAPAVVDACTPASITTQPEDQTNTRGNSIEMIVAAAGTAPVMYQWYMGNSDDYRSPVIGATTNTLTVTPMADARYWVRVSNDCGGVSSRTVYLTINTPPTRPLNVVAARADGLTRVQVTWSASTAAAGISVYRVYRRDVGSSTWVKIGERPAAGPLNWVQNSPLVAEGNGYLYRVVAADNNGVASEPSVADPVVLQQFTDDPVVAGTAVVRGVHVDQLRRAIDLLRGTASLPPLWSGAPAITGPILAAHFEQMRTALADARAVLGLPTIAYTGPAVPGAPVFASDVQAMRNGVK